MEETEKKIEESPNGQEPALRLDLYIEALIFASDYALNIEEIRKVINVILMRIWPSNLEL